MKEEMLYGHPKYDVEKLADTIQRANEAETTQPELYAAAIKLLTRRQKALGIVLKAAMKSRSK